MMNRGSVRRGFEAEDLVAELFQRLGYEVRREVLIAGLEVDLVVEKDGQKTPVEVRFASQRVSLPMMLETAARLLPLRSNGLEIERPIIIVGEVSIEAKSWAQSQFGISVWDVKVLKEKIGKFEDLSQRLMKLIGEEAYSSEEPEPSAKSPDMETSLIRELEEHEKSGGLTPAQYEDLCYRVMIFLFDPLLYGFEKQHKTTDGANRYDFICRIKSGNPFWDSIRSDFRTRSILFECKNYEDRITADQVYSTERYLFSGALRTVCLLISRKGPDDGCRRAAQGALREAGKLILLLSNTDLVRMLRLRSDEDGPASVLDQEIWTLTTTLPR